MSRLIKKKIVFLTIGDKKYKYTETLYEIIEPIPIIDLTQTPDSSTQASPAHTIPINSEDEGLISYFVYL